MRTSANIGSISRRNFDENNPSAIPIWCWMFCLTGRLTRRPAPRYGVPSRQAWPGECWPLTRSPQSTTWSERSWALSNATRIITKILAVFEVAAVDGSVVHEALQLPFSDFEDASDGSRRAFGGMRFHPDTRPQTIPGISSLHSYGGSNDSPFAPNNKPRRTSLLRDDGVHFADVPEKRVAQPVALPRPSHQSRDVDEFEDRGNDLRRPAECHKPLKPRVGNRQARRCWARSYRSGNSRSSHYASA